MVTVQFVGVVHFELGDRQLGQPLWFSTPPVAWSGLAECLLAPAGYPKARFAVHLCFGLGEVGWALPRRPGPELKGEQHVLVGLRLDGTGLESARLRLGSVAAPPARPAPGKAPGTARASPPGKRGARGRPRPTPISTDHRDPASGCRPPIGPPLGEGADGPGQTTGRHGGPLEGASTLRLCLPVVKSNCEGDLQSRTPTGPPPQRSCASCWPPGGDCHDQAHRLGAIARQRADPPACHRPGRGKVRADPTAVQWGGRVDPKQGTYVLLDFRSL